MKQNYFIECETKFFIYVYGQFSILYWDCDFFCFILKQAQNTI